MNKIIEYTYYLSLNEEDRERIYFIKDKKLILIFRIQYESLINKKWIPIVRYDTAHIDQYPLGHKDILHPNPQNSRKTDLKKFGVYSLEKAFRYAENDIKNNWKKYKNLYLKKLEQL